MQRLNESVGQNLARVARDQTETIATRIWQPAVGGKMGKDRFRRGERKARRRRKYRAGTTIGTLFPRYPAWSLSMKGSDATQKGFRALEFTVQ